MASINYFPAHEPKSEYQCSVKARQITTERECAVSLFMKYESESLIESSKTLIESDFPMYIERIDDNSKIFTYARQSVGGSISDPRYDIGIKLTISVTQFNKKTLEQQRHIKEIVTFKNNVYDANRSLRFFLGYAENNYSTAQILEKEGEWEWEMAEIGAQFYSDHSQTYNKPTDLTYQYDYVNLTDSKNYEYETAYGDIVKHTHEIIIIKNPTFSSGQQWLNACKALEFNNG